jgi:general stress protein 26
MNRHQAVNNMRETKEYNHQAATEKLRSLISKGSICMMATTNDEGKISSRPMTTIDIDNDGTIWFFTSEQSGKVEEQEQDSSVYLMYSDPGKQTYIHINGYSESIHDKEKIKQLWTPALKAWFPQGAEDPNLCLLKVKVEEAHYWDSSSSKMIVFFRMVKAILSHEKYDEGETGALHISATKEKSTGKQN